MKINCINNFLLMQFANSATVIHEAQRENQSEKRQQ